MPDEIIDPHMFGTVMASQAESAARMFSLLTAVENGLYDVSEAILGEVIEEGPESINTLIYGLLGSFTGMVTLFCAMTNQEPHGFVQRLATGNAQMMEVGREIVRQAEEAG